MITNINLKILEYAIDKAIDLWIFTELFIKTNSNYKYDFYETLWREVGRKKLTCDEFLELKNLLRLYIKNKERNKK